MKPASFAVPPAAPHHAVIFSSTRSDREAAACGEGSTRTLERGREQPGFPGVESARGANGLGLPVSTWTDQAGVAAWRGHAEHAQARRYGRTARYDHFVARGARVERAFPGSGSPST